MHPTARGCTLFLALLFAAAAAPRPIHARALAQSGTSFATQIEQLSEPEGNFDTDNLISNERAYLHVIPALVSRGVTGGAYIGVGPDQNFSYIARIRPSVAFIVDIRRDNLLLHLLFKALFARSRTRVEYLSQLTGRAPPVEIERWKQASIADIIKEIEGRTTLPDNVAMLRRQTDATVLTFGVKLSADDVKTIDRFHRAFINAGLGLQFHSFGRPPQVFYPTLRELILATDAGGHAWNYLASEDDFQFVKALEARDGVIPVVGDVAGPHAMRAIADAIAARTTKVSALYISNVETYLDRDGAYARFADNIAHLPRDERSVIIRSIFGGGGASTSVVDALDSLRPDSPPRGRFR